MSQEVLQPTKDQITNCELMGWEYVGDGLFEHVSNGLIGHFTHHGFIKE